MRAAPDETLSNAIAGPLVVALAEQFGGRRVDMRLTTAEVEPMETGVSAVRGTGQVQVGGRGEWIGFNYELGYDSRLRRAAFPDVSIGGAASGERDMPNDVALVEQLEAQVTAALAHDLRQPSAWLRLDRITTVEGGSRFLRINANGMAYFGREGSGVPLTIEALYDRTRSAWERFEYGLGDTRTPPRRPSAAMR